MRSAVFPEGWVGTDAAIHPFMVSDPKAFSLKSMTPELLHLLAAGKAARKALPPETVRPLPLAAAVLAWLTPEEEGHEPPNPFLRRSLG
jgi:hypothetical protein